MAEIIAHDSLFALPVHALDPESRPLCRLRGLDAAGLARTRPRVGWLSAAAKPVTVMGLSFPIAWVSLPGLSDKDAKHLRGLAQLGVGFIEVGTLTPKPQPGNPQPRVFRLPEHEALINRLGFNNGGVDDALKRLQTRDTTVPVASASARTQSPRSSVQPTTTCWRCGRVYATADYITINIAAPNTRICATCRRQIRSPRWSGRSPTKAAAWPACMVAAAQSR